MSDLSKTGFNHSSIINGVNSTKKRTLEYDTVNENDKKIKLEQNKYHVKVIYIIYTHFLNLYIYIFFFCFFKIYIFIIILYFISFIFIIFCFYFIFLIKKNI